MSTSVISAITGTLERNLLRLKRNVASIVSAFVIPGLFLLAFYSVFGHAANQAGLDYARYLLAACMFQAVMFAAGGSAMALAVDEESGLLQRIRALPVSPSVSVVGRLGCDFLRSVASLVTVVVIALLLGAKPASFSNLVLAMAVAAAIGVVLAMFFTGVTMHSSHPVQAASLIQGIEMPLLVASTAFVPADTLPSWLEPVITHLPFSPLIDTVRALLSGDELGSTGWEALAWLAFGLVSGSIWVVRSIRRN